MAFRDTDADVVAAAGKPISEIFIDDGEEHFRGPRAQPPSPTRSTSTTACSASAGERCSSPDTRALLRGHTVVLLDVDLALPRRSASA